tara:strand:+ start:7521 stop:8093 length:573 start_codon:yes stop_codon:yes gene_type:complete
MKNSLNLLFAIALLGFISCGEDDGDAAGCPDGFEGDNCTEQVNTKFIGTYDVQMYGQLSGSIGGLASITLDAGTEASPKTTTAVITQGAEDGPDEVRINVVLPLTAAGDIDSEFTIPVEIVGEVRNSTEYYIPQTSIGFAFTVPIPVIGGIPASANLSFGVNGVFQGDTLVSTLNGGGDFAGTIVMKGLK